MSPAANFLFYKAQMVAARLGWKPPCLYNPRLQQRLFRITAPTQIIWAEQDKLAPVALGELFQDAIAGARLVRIPGSSHSLLLEQPQRVAELVSQFLSP